MKHHMIRKIGVTLLMTFAVAFLARGAVNGLAAADSAYNAGNYQQAVELYQGVMLDAGTSAGAYYNLGNAYYQLGDLGNARLCYERARRLDPRNGDINNNLDYLKSKVEDANRASLDDKKLSVKPSEPGFFEGLHRVVALDMSSEWWGWLAAGAFLLLMGCVAMYLFSSNVNVRKTGFFGGGLCLCFCGIFLCFAFMAARACERHNDGVLMSFRTPLLAEPSADSKPSTSPLNRGTRLHILAEETGPDGKSAWYKVRLNDDFVGWLPARDFEVI